MLLADLEWQNPKITEMKITEFGTGHHEFKMETCCRLGSRQVSG